MSENVKRSPRCEAGPHFLFLILIISIVLVPILSFKISSQFVFPYPKFSDLVFDFQDEFKHLTSYERPLGAESGYRDLMGPLLGMRRLSADIAWISVLQYYGSHERSEEHSEFGAGNYPAMKKIILRVMRLDPSFHFACLYGAGALAYGLDRPQEAIELLKEGIQYAPTYWRYRLYLAAIIYKQKGRFDDMIRLLEDAIQYPDCPTMVKSILANIYKERKNYKRSLEIWIEIYENEKSDTSYIERAEKQIQELKKKLGYQ